MAGASAGNRDAGVAEHGVAYLGAPVEVRSRFDGAWVQGFQVAEVTSIGDKTAFRIRRLSDGAVLPTLFAARDVAVIR